MPAVVQEFASIGLPPVAPPNASRFEVWLYPNASPMSPQQAWIGEAPAMDGTRAYGPTWEAALQQCIGRISAEKRRDGRGKLRDLVLNTKHNRIPPKGCIVRKIAMN